MHRQWVLNAEGIRWASAPADSQLIRVQGPINQTDRGGVSQDDPHAPVLGTELAYIFKFPEIFEWPPGRRTPRNALQ